MSKLLQSIHSELRKNATPETQASALKFVPNATLVYGVKMPFLNSMAKKYKDGGFELINELWKSGAFEEKILAAKLVGELSKADPVKAIETVREFSKKIDNWALCDTIGMQSLKPIAKKNQEEIFRLSSSLISSKDPWQRRLSLVLVEVYTKDKSLHGEIQKRIDTLKDDKEYYVRKSVQWLERNLAK